MLRDRAPTPPSAPAELRARTDRDRLWLAALLGSDRLPPRATALVPLGDAHDGGRRVTRVSWGPRLTVIAKPRALAADRIWHRAVRWLARRTGMGEARLPGLVDRGRYGWVEALPRRRPRGRAAVDRFHRRAGALLALADVLQMRDIHVDNLLPVGDHPVLVDAETIAHPRLARFRRVPSLAITGFLPVPGRGNREAGIFAGLGRRDRPLAVMEPVIAGYVAGYRALREHGDQLRSATGPLRGLGDTLTRVVIRPTRIYREHLRTGAPLPGERFGTRAVTATIEAAERAALHRGDVPWFHARGAGTDLLADGRVLVAGWFRRSGLAEIEARLDQLSAADLRRQVALIRGWLAVTALAGGRGTGGRGR